MEMLRKHPDSTGAGFSQPWTNLRVADPRKQTLIDSEGIKFKVCRRSVFGSWEDPERSAKHLRSRQKMQERETMRERDKQTE